MRDSESLPCPSRSRIRPGVPTTTSTPRLQREPLGGVADAAVQNGRCEGRSERAQHLLDLERKLTGRGDDQRLRACAAARQALDHRDQEGERLARSGLGFDDDVPLRP